MATIDMLLADGESRMRGALEALERELQNLRTGRANPALVARLLVDYYGVPTPLNQLATVTVPETRVVAIQPWDRSALPAVEKAILRSDLSVNPTNDGSVVRIVLPALTEERRKELVRVARQRTEDSRVAVRNVRRDINEKLRGLERAKELSQDEGSTARERLQKLTDSFISQIDRRSATKETEVMEV
jgi:ribosome recycling factor